MTDTLKIRIHGGEDLPTLIYLPGLHGDWTLVASFRAAVEGRVRFVEFAYPCRTDWKLRDYATAALEALEVNNIRRGWILAESFGSQVAWACLEPFAARAFLFQPDGIILAGGFVRHPIIRGVHALSLVHRSMPWSLYRLLLRIYAAYARLRHRHAPETLATITEFVARRTREDRDAIASRYPLIAGNDVRQTVATTRCPVFQLGGFFDPIVPWLPVRKWLRTNCANFRDSRIIWNADHNVLGTAPQSSAKQILEWMACATSRRPNQ